VRIKISLEKIANFIKKKYQWILGVIFVLMLCLSIFIYYQYVYLVIKAQPEIIAEKVMLDYENLDKFLKNIDTRQENLSRVQVTKYFDPFND
jgi:hypothetical protein